MPRKSTSPLSRITYIIDPSGCHICISHGTNRDGYPIINVKGRTLLITRYLWGELRGPIPPGMVLRHTCDNPNCINLDHLILGTHQDNVQDRVAKDRSAQGSEHGRAKLDELDVRIILMSSLPNNQLAEIFGVDRKLIYNIRQGKIWKRISQSGDFGFLGFALASLLEERYAMNALPERPLRWQNLMAFSMEDMADQQPIAVSLPVFQETAAE